MKGSIEKGKFNTISAVIPGPPTTVVVASSDEAHTWKECIMLG